MGKWKGEVRGREGVLETHWGKCDTSRVRWWDALGSQPSQMGHASPSPAFWHRTDSEISMHRYITLTRRQRIPAPNQGAADILLIPEHRAQAPDARGVPSTQHMHQGATQLYPTNDRLTWSCQIGPNVSARVRRILSFISKDERRDWNAAPRHPTTRLAGSRPTGGRFINGIIAAAPRGSERDTPSKPDRRVYPAVEALHYFVTPMFQADERQDLLLPAGSTDVAKRVPMMITVCYVKTVTKPSLEKPKILTHTKRALRNIPWEHNDLTRLAHQKRSRRLDTWKTYRLRCPGKRGEVLRGVWSEGLVKSLR
ncbi:hypothetical protein FA13DRAFT_1718746 [Coprinellus micaceus]|uniref:Uncharacterized protein n=1 Tax=Coprinellus micaceus TaxID=71717 RepID=A0A4Y7SCP1_COPMI|nr:hypothetical protein FA13DRAFT_1718746 [Coprinellus micaceus]